MKPKFRVWDKLTNTMRCVKEIEFGSKGARIIRLSNIEPNCYDNNKRWRSSVILMQSTGVKDKKGVEIYEGDIVKVIEDSIFGGTYIGVIKFIEDLGVYGFSVHNANVLETRRYSRDSIVFNTKMFGDHFTLIEARYCDDEFEIEVVGNAYENYELMEVTK